MTIWRLVSVVGLGVLVSTTHSLAWDAAGHRITTLEALALLPEEMPGFLQTSADEIAWDSIDPDLMRNDDLPQLRDREAPDHYLDLEQLEQRRLPEKRTEFLAELARAQTPLSVSQVGAVPYAVVESTQRLILAFAQHRLRPDDPYLQAKARVYTALMAHYAADLCQPLHTTIHHDGRALQDGSSPQTGIHQQVDGLIGRLNPQDDVDPGLGESPVLDPLFQSVVAELERSHSEVDGVYEMEGDLARLYAGGLASARLAAFTRERYRASVLFAARLIVTAWRLSATLDLPDWGLREPQPAD